MNYTVVIPNRFEDVIQPLLRSFEIYEPKLKVVIIADNHERDYGYDLVSIYGNFIFSRSANAGFKYAKTDDVILINDDVRLIQQGTFDTLSRMAYLKPRIGILAPLVYGGCGNIYMRANRSDLWHDNTSGLHYCTGLRGPDRVTFACVYIRRTLIDRIGLMDEKFDGYGFDDADFCIRTVQAGWNIAITNRTVVQHGSGGSKFERGKNWNSSFTRNRIGGTQRNLTYLMSKHPSVFEDNLKNERT